MSWIIDPGPGEDLLSEKCPDIEQLDFHILLGNWELRPTKTDVLAGFGLSSIVCQGEIIFTFVISRGWDCHGVSAKIREGFLSLTCLFFLSLKLTNVIIYYMLCWTEGIIMVKGIILNGWSVINSSPSSPLVWSI